MIKSIQYNAMTDTKISGVLICISIEFCKKLRICETVAIFDLYK